MVSIKPVGILKGGKIRGRSKIVPMVVVGGHADNVTYDRKFLYKALHERSDRLGFLIPTQQEFAADVDIPYQTLSIYIDDFVRAGFMKKSGRNPALRKFRVVYHPDDCDWDAFYDFLNPHLIERR